MDANTKKVFMMMAVGAAFLLSVVISQTLNVTRKAQEQKVRLLQVGHLQFKGKVVNSRTYKYYGKNFYMVCVKLDTTNVKSFLVYNDLDCLKINGGIATFSAGYLNYTLGIADSVEANMNNSGKLVFYYKGHAKESVPLGFDPKGLHEDDLNNCN